MIDEELSETEREVWNEKRKAMKREVEARAKSRELQKQMEEYAANRDLVIPAQSKAKNDELSDRIIGGKEVIAFIIVEEKDKMSIQPLPASGSTGFAFRGGVTGSIDIWGIDSKIGQSIASAYKCGIFPSNDEQVRRAVLEGDLNVE